MDLLSIHQISRMATSKTLLPDKKSSLFALNKHGTFHANHTKIPPLQITNCITENNSEPLLKHPIFSTRFTVKTSIFFKKSSTSLSPITKTASEKTIVKDDKFDFSKLKKAKETSQESEIKLQHLYNQLVEAAESEERSNSFEVDSMRKPQDNLKKSLLF